MKKIYHQVGMYVKQIDENSIPHISKWIGESDKTLSRQVSQILEVIVRQAQKFSLKKHCHLILELASQYLVG